MNEAAILDASPIILLARAGYLDFLQILKRPLVVPRPVVEEIREKGARDAAVLALRRRADLLTEVPGVATDGSAAAWNLGRGETSVLSLARKEPGSIAVLDDLQARRCAEWLEIPTTGTVGIVLRAKQGGLVPAARPLLQRLISEGMHLSPRTLDAVLLRVGE